MIQVRKLFLLLILALVPIIDISANDRVLIEAKVYRTDEGDDSKSLKDILDNAVLEHSPSLISSYGKKSGLRFNYAKEPSAQASVVEISVLSNKQSNTYDLGINLINEENKNISRIYGHPIGQQFIVSTVIDGAKRIIKVDVNESKISAKTASAINKVKSPPKATYILQVGSNLACDSFDIELKSQNLKNNGFLTYKSSAYAVVELPQDKYTFGNVFCSKGNQRQEMALLRDKLEPFSLVAGRIYYGGTLVFQKFGQIETASEPKVLDNCTNLISRARGAPDNECRDGVGVESEAQKNYKINAYAPEVTPNEIELVNTALSLAENQLEYLPIVYKQQ